LSAAAAAAHTGTLVFVQLVALAVEFLVLRAAAVRGAQIIRTPIGAAAAVNQYLALFHLV
jgi:hypothetical protein